MDEDINISDDIDTNSMWFVNSSTTQSQPLIHIKCLKRLTLPPLPVTS